MRRVELLENWHIDGPVIMGRTPMLNAGTYRVPEDLSAEMADQAVADGIAVDLLAPKNAPPVPATSRRWLNQCVVVAASGPSLTKDVAKACIGYPTIAVNDAYRIMTYADVLYACDPEWWQHHEGCPEFKGEKWSSHGGEKHDDKRAAAAAWGLNLIGGKTARGFSRSADLIHYGSNSGFQAVNLAIAWGASRVVLVGFDMRAIDGRRHFFGDHPETLRNTDNWSQFIAAFHEAAKRMPKGVEIINATPGSALTCFRSMDLAAALSDRA